MTTNLELIRVPEQYDPSCAVNHMEHLGSLFHHLVHSEHRVDPAVGKRTGCLHPPGHLAADPFHRWCGEHGAHRQRRRVVLGEKSKDSLLPSLPISAPNG